MKAKKAIWDIAKIPSFSKDFEKLSPKEKWVGLTQIGGCEMNPENIKMFDNLTEEKRHQKQKQ